MKKPATKILALAVAIGVVVIAISAARRFRGYTGEQRCGDGFHAEGARCLPPMAAFRTAGLVDVPETSLAIGPSDWEAEGRVPARKIHVKPFRLDAFEVTVDRVCKHDPKRAFCSGDRLRAAFGISRQEARETCRAFGGRLPTEDEWIAAAAGGNPDKPRRYPWGDTGAVCRRAAWGLVKGPCAEGADGPDTVGAHADGATPSGIHDLAGNVAEWVESEASIVLGGAYDTTLATELRTWSRREVPPDTRAASIGFRCAYDRADP